MNWQCSSGVSEDELEGLRRNIEFKVSQSVRGLVENDLVTSMKSVSDSCFESHLNKIQSLGKQNNQSKEPKSYSSRNQIKYRQGRHFLFSPQAALCLTTPLHVCSFVSSSSSLGHRLYRTSRTPHPTMLLWMSMPDVLEAAEGQGHEKGTQGSCRFEERTTSWKRHERKGSGHFYHWSVALRGHDVIYT